MTRENFDDLRRCMATLLAATAAARWSGIVYRYCAEFYGDDASILSGEGSFLAGGRWNAPASFHAVYCASTPELAHREYLAGMRAAGFPIHHALPVTGKALEVRSVRALDLRNRQVLTGLRLTAEDLRADDWRSATDAGRESLCQRIGRAARQEGAQALLVPSFQAQSAGDFNVVLIRENLDDEARSVSILRRPAK